MFPRPQIKDTYIFWLATLFGNTDDSWWNHGQSCSFLTIFKYNKRWRNREENIFSTFFKGTNKCAHRVHEYNGTKFDATVVVDVTGLDDQALPSPPMMAPYEDAPPNCCLGDYILKHPSMEGVSIPDATGACVRVYGRVLCLAYMNKILSHVFSQSTDSYVETPVSIRMAVLSIRDEVVSDRGEPFFGQTTNSKTRQQASTTPSTTKWLNVCSWGL